MATQPGKVALLALFLLCLAAIGNPMSKTTMFEDRAHTVLGTADLIVVGDRLLVNGTSEDGRAALAIDVRGENAFNITFEPLEIAVGSELTTTLRGANGMIIGRIDLVQRDAHATDVFLRVEDALPYLSDGTVRISTHLDGQTTHEATLDAVGVMNLGTVRSTAAARPKRTIGSASTANARC